MKGVQQLFEDLKTLESPLKLPLMAGILYIYYWLASWVLKYLRGGFDNFVLHFLNGKKIPCICLLPLERKMNSIEKP